jgi:hypothetical protein
MEEFEVFSVKLVLSDDQCMSVCVCVFVEWCSYEGKSSTMNAFQMQGTNSDRMDNASVYCSMIISKW